MFDIYSKIVPNHTFSKSDLVQAEYENKQISIERNFDTFFQMLSKTTNKISASGSSNTVPATDIPGISVNGKGTGYIKGEVTKFEIFSYIYTYSCEY